MSNAMNTHYWDEILDVLVEEGRPMRVSDIVDELEGKPHYEEWRSETYSDEGEKSLQTVRGIVGGAMLNLTFGHRDVVERTGKKYRIHPKYDGVLLSERMRKDGRPPYSMVSYTVDGERRETSPHVEREPKRKYTRPVEKPPEVMVFIVRVEDNGVADDIIMALNGLDGVDVTLV